VGGGLEESRRETLLAIAYAGEALCYKRYERGGEGETGDQEDW
jgi:hypothetical protein